MLIYLCLTLFYGCLFVKAKSMMSCQSKVSAAEAVALVGLAQAPCLECDPVLAASAPELGTDQPC